MIDHFFQAASYIAILTVYANAAPSITESSDHAPKLVRDGVANPKAGVTCPPGWTVGHDLYSNDNYCFNCGLPDRGILGCPAQGLKTAQNGCVGGGCTIYDSTLCWQFKGHVMGLGPQKNSNCTGINVDDGKIFPDVNGASTAVECYQSGKHEIVSAAYVGERSRFQGASWSNMCGFLLDHCHDGLHAEAVIYDMNADANAQTGANDDFSKYAWGALKLAQGPGQC